MGSAKSQNALTSDTSKKIDYARPLLKWAGGKKQLLSDLISKMPEHFNKYIEPFFGGGALFYATQPSTGVIADSNPEIINLYKMVAENVEGVISCLKRYENTEDVFIPFNPEIKSMVTIGMMLSRKIIEAHQGSLDMELTPSGKKFKISL